MLNKMFTFPRLISNGSNVTLVVSDLYENDVGVTKIRAALPIYG